VVLYGIYLLLLCASVFIIGKVIYLIVVWKPEPKIVAQLTPRDTKHVTEAVRGSILDCNGRILAMSYPIFDLHLDCTVEKDEDWNKGMAALCEKLPEVLPGKSSEEYLNWFKSERAKKNKYLSLGGPVEIGTVKALKALPMFCKDQNKSGLIVERRNIRRYPYGPLAKRTIGFIRDTTLGLDNNYIGIEGKFDYILHGTDGYEWIRPTDKGEKVRNMDSIIVKAVDGKDVTITLNIDYQEMADAALRKQIEPESDLVSACLVLMEVKTGAIRAMVNLTRDTKTRKFEEIGNVAIGRRHEPGSVFKTVTLLSVLSDGKIKSLNEKIPTNHGKVEGAKIPVDKHIIEYENLEHTNRISILEGFKRSSNYVFATLAIKNYGQDPMHFIDRIYSYKLGEAFDFDLVGLKTPSIPLPYTGKKVNLTELASLGYGYNTQETPLHILNFYNAIAAKGKMSKPYLVGNPSVLNAAICTKEVADTITRALKAVTEEGTAKKLKEAKISIAGKTGTSFGTFLKADAGKTPYFDKSERQKYQGTFVGFFPVEDPQYSIICSIYSKPTTHNPKFQGGGIPALVVKDILDYLYKEDPYWRTKL